MSYLHLPLILMDDFSKGTLSLWFRFSDDSVNKAIEYAANYVPSFHPEQPEIFRGTIPLVTFGRKVMAQVYDTVPKTFSQTAIDGTVLTQTVLQVESVGEAPCEPSHIGIYCQEGEDPRLIMAFQTETRASVQGLVEQITNVNWVLLEGASTYDMHRTLEDVSYVRVGEPERFYIRPTFKVEPDKWHHLLVSFDFSESIDVVAASVPDTSVFETEEQIRAATIQSYCKLWFAFDDVNMKGKDNIGNNILGQTPAGWVPADENGIIPENAEGAILAYTPIPPATDSDGNPLNTGGGQNSEYHWTASPIPMNTGSVGLPASAEYVQTIYHCEMAELQMWGGVTLDTDLKSSRRAFVDENGKPVEPKRTEDDVRTPAEKILGKRPDIMLHGNTKWIEGYNTGTVGVSVEIAPDGSETLTKRPQGQFTPVAGIEKYKPEPELQKEIPTA